MNSTHLKYASRLLSLGSVGLLLASVALVSDSFDLTERIGRHLVAGSLANACLAIVLLLIAQGPLRKGERWTFWAFLIPLLLYGIPMLAIDVAFVQSDRRWVTVAPQLCGIVLLVVGLWLAYRGMFKNS